MTLKKSTLNNILLSIVVIGAVLLALVGLGGKSADATSTGTGTFNENGVQVLDLNAKGGYRPAVITAQANVESILRVKTANTFDCSSALTIPSLGYRKMLPISGNTDIPIPPQAPGTEIFGTCTMGMYDFLIKFV